MTTTDDTIEEVVVEFEVKFNTGLPANIKHAQVLFLREKLSALKEKWVAEERERILTVIQNINLVDAHDDSDASLLKDSHVIKMARSSYDDLMASLEARTNKPL